MAEPYVFKTFQIRSDMMEAIDRYLEHGFQPGSFLTAVLAHDLVGACAHADHWNLSQLPAFAAYMYNEMPSNAHGSYTIVDAWIEKGGRNGTASVSTGAG